MRLTSSQLIILAVAVALCGCGLRTARNQSSTASLADVNGVAVTAETFRYWWSKTGPTADTPEARRKLLDQLVERAALVQAARAEGLDSDPEMVEAIESLLIARLKEKRLQPQIEAIQVSEQEARLVFDTQKQARYSEPERMHAAVLWFETRREQPLIARYQPRLEKARAAAVSGISAEAGFGQLAINNSEHPASRYKGGDIGWVAPTESDRWRRAVAEIAAGLKPGEVSPVIGRDEGLFVVRLIERSAPRDRDFNEVRGDIVRKLRNEKRAAVEQQFLASVTTQSVVNKFQERLADLPNLPVQTNQFARVSQNTFRPQP